MLKEGITVGTVSKRDVESISVSKPLLHPGTNAVVVILCLDDSNRDVRFEVEDVVSPLWSTALHHPSSYDHPTFGEVHFFTHLGLQIPSCLHNGRSD